MKIAVYGGNGMVGSQIVNEAVTRGHEVTVLSRSGQLADEALAGKVSSQQADVTDVNKIQELAQDNDVIVISVPPARDGGDHAPILNTHEELAETLLPTRLFVIGGAGALQVGDAQLKDQPGFPDAYKAEAETMSKALDAYRDSSGVNWTMLAPAPMIAPGERTGHYKLGAESPVGDSISTQDFAVAVLDEIENPQHRERRFTVAN